MTDTKEGYSLLTGTLPLGLLQDILVWRYHSTTHQPTQCPTSDSCDCEQSMRVVGNVRSSTTTTDNATGNGMH